MTRRECDLLPPLPSSLLPSSPLSSPLLSSSLPHLSFKIFSKHDPDDTGYLSQVTPPAVSQLADCSQRGLIEALEDLGVHLNSQQLGERKRRRRSRRSRTRRRGRGRRRRRKMRRRRGGVLTWQQRI
eukprot:539514-Hanusia_phi.AAC.1